MVIGKVSAKEQLRARTVADRVKRAGALRQFAETASRVALNDELAVLRTTAARLVRSGDIAYDEDGSVENPLITVTTGGNAEMQRVLRAAKKHIGNELVEAFRRQIVEAIEDEAHPQR